MVKLLVCFLCVANFLYADVNVDAQVDANKFYEMQPISGTITITHENYEKISQDSFKIGGKSLKVTPVQETSISPTSTLQISIFKFDLTGQTKGLHLLPEITVRVGNSTYSSIPSSYEVASTTSQVGVTAQTTNTNLPVLKLEAIINAPAKIYPGQKFTVTYRYTFNGNIELQNEVLPLLEGQGFEKIGTEQIKDFEQQDWSVREITQLLLAKKPGDYNFDTSKVSGYAYQIKNGSRLYLQPSIQAEAPPITLHVLPFPSKGKPLSFNGAIGPFSSLRATMLTPETVNLGDKVTLNVELEGDGNLESAPPPELCCLPGFSGLFRVSDLPPTQEIKGKIKAFAIDLRPLSLDIKAIPSIEYSFFLPDSSSYQSLHSSELPLTVKQSIKSKEAPLPKPGQGQASDIPSFTNTSQPIEIGGFEQLQPADLQNLPFGDWRVLWVFPFLLFFFLLQYLWKKMRQHQEIVAQVKTAEEILNSALKLKPGHPSFYQLLSRAFMLRLAEKGKLESPDIIPESLPKEGIIGEVRAFLTALDEKRFSGQGYKIDGTSIKQARQLFYKI